MPKEKRNCDHGVKQLCQRVCLRHRTCCKSRHKPSYYSGELLCKVIGGVAGIDLDIGKDYRVCRDLSRIIESSNTRICASPPSAVTPSNYTFKRVKIAVGNDTVLCKDLCEKPSRSYKRRNQVQLLQDSIGEKAKRYYRKYSDLSLMERKRRVKVLADEVLAACIDREYVNGNILMHIHQNHELLVDLVTVMDMIKL